MAPDQVKSIGLVIFLSQNTKTKHAADMSAQSLSDNRNAMH